MTSAPTTGAGLGTGGPPRTRRVLGAGLAVLAAVALGVAVLDRRDPAAYRDRDVLPDCGNVLADIGGDVPRTAAVRCFDAAVGSTAGAELLVVTTTVEGDPVRSTHRALPDGGVEVLVDATDDDFGPGDWSRLRCPAATALQSLGACEQQRL